MVAFLKFVHTCHQGATPFWLRCFLKTLCPYVKLVQITKNLSQSAQFFWIPSQLLPNLALLYIIYYILYIIYYILYIIYYILYIYIYILYIIYIHIYICIYIYVIQHMIIKTYIFIGLPKHELDTWMQRWRPWKMERVLLLHEQIGMGTSALFNIILWRTIPEEIGHDKLLQRLSKLQGKLFHVTIYLTMLYVFILLFIMLEEIYEWMVVTPYDKCEQLSQC